MLRTAGKCEIGLYTNVSVNVASAVLEMSYRGLCMQQPLCSINLRDITNEPCATYGKPIRDITGVCLF